MPSCCKVSRPDNLYNPLTPFSFLPESPRFLISKERYEEAFKVLVTYHAEGDENSEFAKAEMAEIKTTIAIELEHSKRSWMDMLSTSGNRRRVLIGSLLGVMSQLSGNVVISYYLGDILNLIGFTDPNFQAKYNIGNQCWGLVCAVFTALLVMKFRRRTMYLTSIFGILAIYVAWTISSASAIVGGSQDAGKLCLFWIYAYQPAYNIGFNALTYSKYQNSVVLGHLTNCCFPAYLVEIFPFAMRARGISIFQFFGKAAQVKSINTSPTY